MAKRIKTALIYAVVAMFWALLIKSMIDTFRAPIPSLAPLIEPIGRSIPLLVILAAAYAIYRIWRAFKAGLRRVMTSYRHKLTSTRTARTEYTH